MENQEELNPDFDCSVETISALFGDTVSKDVIMAVIENCEGNLNLAAEIVMSMANDAVDKERETAADVTSTSPSQQDTISQPAVEHNLQTNIVASPQPNVQVAPTLVYTPPTMSYASASTRTGAVPKQTVPKPHPPNKSIVWTDQIGRILSHHCQGSRILIFMRGAPGSGKSILARQIVEMTVGSTYADYNTHIFSTDDFFMVRGQYQYEKFRLSEAHDWNQRRVRQALMQGLSPIIVDNTNIEIWEMSPYIKEGVRNGYIIEVVEPNTPWARKANQLVKKSTHKVPPATIRRMLDNFQGGITGADLIRMNGLSYPASMKPPVLRNMPVYIPPPASNPTEILSTTGSNSPPNIETREHLAENATAQIPDTTSSLLVKRQPEIIISPSCFITSETVEEQETEQEQAEKQKRYLEIQKQIEEMEKVEEEWENGESWEKKQENDSRDNNASVQIGPLPQRTNSEGSTPRENFLEAVQKCDDWSKLSMFMPSWSDEQQSSSRSYPIEIPVMETRSSSTCMEIGDADINNRNICKKIVTASPRDINLYHIPDLKEKIPQVRMIDKCTTTNEPQEVKVINSYRCKNEEHHFAAFRKLFKNVPKAALRDVFEKCCGDANWAVDIVLGSLADNQLEIVDGEESDTEIEIAEECNCLAAYNVVPDTRPAATATPLSPDALEFNPSEALKLNTPQRKSKPLPTETSFQLKREIEKNIVLSDNHYSDHMLKIKKWRHGDYMDENSPNNVFDTTSFRSNMRDSPSHPGPSTSNAYVTEDNNQQTKDIASSLSDDESSNTSSVDDAERTVNINVGREFIAQLDELFGRKGMPYPENIVPRINIPISLLNEINAFWMESFMYQLDEQDKQNAKMLKEDAEFARQLEMKEAELAQQGKEPEIPDFKEIMDMDFAISLYQKDVAEWRNKEPNDMAAKLSRDKLYNLFPDMSPDILSELLMAHDNNFQATVEVLLMSTGKANILEEKNGLNKFVMEKEMERQERLLEEEKKTLCEVEWPLLPKGEKVEMSMVNGYREEADKHLNRRNLNYQKAQDYIRRGMTQVANYYSDIAAFHKKKYEQANSLAAASLMQVHASNCQDNATIDLHYLRVGEAKEALDLFLDTHIHKLRESPNKAMRYHTLFFITGRGLHSQGRPRVKPAVKKRLRERRLGFSERNPGLLTSRVCADDKLSYQVQVP